MRFAKAHAYGNDFLYVHRSQVPGVDLIALTREMCDRYTGIGADGLIVYAYDAGRAPMQLINSDGSAAEVSGNGVRGLAALVLRDDPAIDAEVVVETAAGAKQVRRLERTASRQQFRSAMGVPTDLGRVTIALGAESVDAVVLNMGNPQCVVLGPLPSPERFQRLGAALERHERFPERTNVEFVEVEAVDRVRILIWERGCGPTQSSGTGSCASLVAAAAYGGAARQATVVAPGGAQTVEWTDESVFLTGWAEVICEGQWLRPLPLAATQAVR